MHLCTMRDRRYSFACYNVFMYTKRVTIIGKGGEDDKELIRFLSNHYLLKYVIADDFGNLLHNGSPVRESFFNANSDVVLIAPSLDNNSTTFRESLGHMLPVVNNSSYDGIFGANGGKIIWKKSLPKDLVLTPKVHYVVGDSGNILHSQELFRKIQLPVRVHPHGAFGKVVNSFNDLHDSMDEFMKTFGHVYVEDHVPGDVLHLITIPNFRNQLIYKLPIMTQSGNGYAKVNHLSDETKDKLIRIVDRLHHDLGLSGSIQFDFVINKKGAYLRDIITRPEKHSNSAFRHAMDYVGASMADFWKNVVEKAREEFRKK